MKRIPKYFQVFLTILVSVIVLSGINYEKAFAASSASYSIKKDDRSKSYGRGSRRVKAKVYYKQVILKGNSKVVKKINKDIQKDYKKFMGDSFVETVHLVAKEKSITPYKKFDLWRNEYHFYADSKVTYNKNSVISIKMTVRTFTGGHFQSKSYGLNYNLKTGKRLTIYDACKGNASTIKNSVIKSIKRAKNIYIDSIGWRTINSYSTNKFEFYLEKGKKAKVCFGPYSLNNIGRGYAFTITSKYN